MGVISFQNQLPIRFGTALKHIELLEVRNSYTHIQISNL